MEKIMTSDLVLEIYSSLDNIGIPIWIDGGWAKDALIGRQTREHRDLDIAVERKNLDKLINYFESLKYKEIPRSEENKWDIVLGDDDSEIDIHAFEFDDNSKIIDKPYWDAYSEDALNGIGHINGIRVRCVNINHLLKTLDEKKRELREKDRHDLSLLLNLKK
ncbi:MAG: aminoglycoside nucleotidyltransferase [Patescibacteria group bacterium]|nr:aminoglycoside nucleotidyltransferase [Patescibacteria group bacterium]